MRSGSRSFLPRSFLPLTLAILLVRLCILAPATASAGPPASFPLRHSFSMAVGLPGAGPHEPTSCIDVPQDSGTTDSRKMGSGDYVCRIVAGYEETGDHRNFSVRSEDALDDGEDPTYGHALVARDGITYEGCWRFREHWFCDYQSRSEVSGKHYESNGYVLRVFWAWKNHTQAQAGCATAMAAFLAGPGWWPFGALVKDCLNGPMERP